MSKASSIREVLRMLGMPDFLGLRSIRQGAPATRAGHKGREGRPERSEGFSLLGVLIAVMIIGIMASIAVPKFSAAIATANTAKIQSDLTNIDAAITMYRLDKGKNPSTLNDLSGYLTDFESIKPPQGSCYVKEQNEPVNLSAASYSVKTLANGECRALCDEKTVAKFGKTTAVAPAPTPGTGD